MRRLVVAALVACHVLLLAGCNATLAGPAIGRGSPSGDHGSLATEPAPTQNETGEYVPISVSLDVMPGYRDSLYFDVGDDSEFEFGVLLVRANPSKKWVPTMFIELADDTSNWAYNYNLSLDMTLMKLWGHAREFDVKGKKVVADRQFQHLYDPDHEIHLRGKFEGRKLSVFLDGQLADTVTVPFDPRQLKFGASSGQFRLRLIQERPAPAPN